MPKTKTGFVVKQLQPDDDEVYISFLDELGLKSPSVTGYHYPFYRQMLVQLGLGEPFYLALVEDGQYLAVLPGFIKSTAAGTVYNSLPFFGPNAGVLYRPDSDIRKAHELLIGHVFSTMQKQSNPISASFYTPFLLTDFDLYAACIPDSIVVEKNTLFLDLNESKWDKKIYYDLRRAQEMGVTIDETIHDKNIQDFYRIYLQNCQDYGIPVKPEACVRILLTTGIQKKQVHASFAFHEGRMIGGLIVVLGPQTAEYYIPCTIYDKRHLQPSTLLIAEAIQKLRARGIGIWNWEASPRDRPSVYQFKKKWGSVDLPYKIFVKRFSSEEDLRRMGTAKIASEFPFYFVYPFDRL